MSEIEGMLVLKFFQKEKKAKSIFNELSKKQTPIHELENSYLHKDGHKVTVFTNAVPIFDKEGNFSGYRGVHKDMTTHKKSEEIIEDLILKNKKLKEIREMKRQKPNKQIEIKETPIIEDKKIEEKIGKNHSRENFDSMFIFPNLSLVNL